MKKASIPKATLGRLPQYLGYLKALPKETGETISATAIAKGLSLGEVQVRKDLSAVSGAGKPKIGYVTADLIRQIELCLGTDRLTPAVLVGAGRLGRALLDYTGFEEYGVEILAAFDLNEETILFGQRARQILPLRLLPSFCKSHNVQIGIITVGTDAAQNVCDRLTESGVGAIWSFASCSLRVPEGTLLKQENLALSLAHLNNQLC